MRWYGNKWASTQAQQIKLTNYKAHHPQTFITPTNISHEHIRSGSSRVRCSIATSLNAKKYGMFLACELPSTHEAAARLDHEWRKLRIEWRKSRIARARAQTFWHRTSTQTRDRLEVSQSSRSTTTIQKKYIIVTTAWWMEVKWSVNVRRCSMQHAALKHKSHTAKERAQGSRHHTQTRMKTYHITPTAMRKAKTRPNGFIVKTMATHWPTNGACGSTRGSDVAAWRYNLHAALTIRIAHNQRESSSFPTPHASHPRQYERQNKAKRQ